MTVSEEKLHYDTLIQKVENYNKSMDKDYIIRAFDFGKKAHEGQTRSNGEPYYSHCIAVAEILAEKQMDTPSIVTALLHDTVEDTNVTSDDIKNNFGEEIANLVKGVTKLEVFEFKQEQATQAENFRKLLLAMSEDIRVLLVKLADRLHNIRTLHFIKKPEKRIRIANETMDIYVPLAERIGIRDWKEELEDICFSHINTDIRESIINRLEFLGKQKDGDIVNQVKQQLLDTLLKNDVKADISGRQKTPYSIWKKMQKKDVGFEQLSDIMAFRVVVDSIEDCYRVLGVVHSQYRLVPGRFKDYISLPKANGYRSLHTGIIGPKFQRIEIQIRTKEMHRLSELGVAAHWNYKSESQPKNAVREGRNYRWLRQLLEILETSSEMEEFWESTRMEMYADQVFAFTPKGDLITLPKGSCPIDFAYAIHSNVGSKTIGAKVNGKIMPLRTQLTNGDQVEIITQNNSEPKASWESFAVSGKARSSIRRFLRQKKRDEYISEGLAILSRVFKSNGFKVSDSDIENLRIKFAYTDSDTLLASIGDGTRSVNECLYYIHPSVRQDKQKQKNDFTNPAKKHTQNNTQDHKIKGLDVDMVVRFPKCCHAIPGDSIVGLIHTGQGVSIHSINCIELNNFKDTQENWLDVSWENQNDSTIFIARIKIIVINNKESLADITATITKTKTKIIDLKITNHYSDFFEMLIDLETHNAQQVVETMAALRLKACVTSVVRI